MKFFKYFIDEITSKSGYKFLFTASVAIAALYLISIVELANLNLPIDIESHKLQYAVEYELKKEIDFSSFECSFEMVTYQDCKLAKHINKIKNESIKALTSLHNILKSLFFLTSILSIAAFILNRYIHKKN